MIEIQAIAESAITAIGAVVCAWFTAKVGQLEARVRKLEGKS